MAPSSIPVSAPLSLTSDNNAGTAPAALPVTTPAPAAPALNAQMQAAWAQYYMQHGYAAAYYGQYQGYDATEASAMSAVAAAPAATSTAAPTPHAAGADATVVGMESAGAYYVLHPETAAANSGATDGQSNLATTTSSATASSMSYEQQQQQQYAQYYEHYKTAFAASANSNSSDNLTAMHQAQPHTLLNTTNLSETSVPPSQSSTASALAEAYYSAVGPMDVSASAPENI